MATEYAERAPRIGDIVHYVMPDGPLKGQHLAASVVRVRADGTLDLKLIPPIRTELGQEATR